MQIQERVRAFLVARAARPICDACIADYLALRREQVATVMHSRRGVSLQRAVGHCSCCCTSRRVSLVPTSS